jgi:methionyl-tRNA formyltransferase
MPCNIVFMGTPDFAVPCLARLLEDGYTVSGVFSQPDRPKGRGYQLQPPPVKELALERGVPVYQPTKMKDGTALGILKELAPDLAVVVAYGRLLPPDLLAVPRLGCINVHASLLPRLRGAAPIQWSVINGDAVTGVTTMHMAEGLDTGDIILQRELAVGADETSGELFGRLSALGADVLSETIPLLLAGTAPRVPQEDSRATWAPPLTKDMAKVDFSRPAASVASLIRGLNPSPVAFTKYGGKRLSLRRAVAVEGFSGTPGEVLSTAPLIVACGDRAVELTEVQPEGKKPMPGADFARGRRLAIGEMFTGD